MRDRASPTRYSTKNELHFYLFCTVFVLNHFCTFSITFYTHFYTFSITFYTQWIRGLRALANWSPIPQVSRGMVFVENYALFSM
jgi:hypothetical protein